MTKKNTATTTNGKYTRRLWALQFTNLYDRKALDFLEPHARVVPFLWDNKLAAAAYLKYRRDLPGIVAVVEVDVNITRVVKKKAVAKKKPRIVNELMVTGRIMSIDFHHDCGMCLVSVKGSQDVLEQAMLETADVLNSFCPSDVADLIRVTKYTDAGGPEITYRLVRTGSVKISAKKLGT